MDINEAFEKTTKFIFGKELEGDLDDYNEWLSKRIPKPIEKKSILSNKKVFVIEDVYPIVSNDEIVIGASVVDGNFDNTESLNDIINKIKPIINYTGNRNIYNSSNIYKSDLCLSSRNVYNSILIQNSEYISNCFDVNLSHMVFGSKLGRYISSSINIYSGVKVTNCLDVNFCSDTSNCLFCCKGSNLDNCMFCFNTNAKKYSVGNLDVGRKKFFELKKIVVGGLIQELEKSKSLKMNIFNILEI